MSRVGRMAQQVKVLATQTCTPELGSWNHVKVEGRRNLISHSCPLCGISPPHHAHTVTINKNLKIHI